MEMHQQQILMYTVEVEVVVDTHKDEIDEQIVLLELQEHLIHIDLVEHDEQVRTDELLHDEVVEVVRDSIK